ncbi:hypothetical protein MI170_07020 [Mycolicibacterium goodii]|uniref:hypothetical protein n=1 Tax=Mycolicibacterium goodii TaxID=134601 RepID=UPI001F033BA1|nr:hypothetical protein [Mycolicibacterium goodii]ULN49110.1 hypothetical protein MI170_07020 [Mycolicibacterium goodii]
MTITKPMISVEALSYVVPPERTIWDIPVPPLPAAGIIQVTEALCTFQTSTTVPVIDDMPPPAPDLAPPLHSCGRAVSVNTRVGAFVEIWADSGSGPTQISTRVRAHRDLMTVRVYPYLTEPQIIWARQLSCGGLVQDSPAYATKPHPPLEPVELRDPLIAGMRLVVPINAISGARIIVMGSTDGRANPEVLGQRDVTMADPAVPLARRLNETDVVWAIQELCGESTSEREHREYPVLPGEKHFTLPAPRQHLSDQSDTGGYVVHSAHFVCRFADGRWMLYADVENTEHGYDCSAVLGVNLNLPNPYQFGGTLDLDLAAADNSLPIGLAMLGYPSRATVTRRAKSTLLQDPGMWVAVLTATAQWTTYFAAWRNYEPPPEMGDWVEGDNAPPDPTQLFPPLPTET